MPGDDFKKRLEALKAKQAAAPATTGGAQSAFQQRLEALKAKQADVQSAAQSTANQASDAAKVVAQQGSQAWGYSSPDLPDFMSVRSEPKPKPAAEPPKPFKQRAGELAGEFSDWLNAQIEGAKYAAPQMATMGTADEIGGTVAHALGLAPGQTADQARATSRQRAREAIRQGPWGAFAGGIVGGAPLALLTQGASLPAQAALAAALYQGTLLGEGEGTPLERADQAQKFIQGHPVESALNVAAPAIAHYGGHALGKLADLFDTKKLRQWGRLITTGTERPKMRRQRGLDAVVERAREAERAGLFGGQAIPSGESVAARAMAVTADEGNRIGKLTGQIRQAAREHWSPEQLVDYGPTIDQLEQADQLLRSSGAPESIAERRLVRKSIEFLKNKTQRDPRGPLPPAEHGEYTPPAEPVSTPPEVEAPAWSVPEPEYTPPAEPNMSSEPQTATVAREGPEVLPAGESRDAQPNAMRFPRKALPTDTTAATPDDVYPPPVGPDPMLGPDRPPPPFPEEWYRAAPPKAPTVDEQTQRFYDNMSREPDSAPLASRGTSSVASNEPTPTGAEPSAALPSESAVGTGLAVSPPQPSGERRATWQQPTEADVRAPQLEANAPRYSVSLDEGLDALADAARRASFDPQAKPETSIARRLHLMRWQGFKDATREGMSKLAQDLPDRNLHGQIQDLADSQQNYSAAQRALYPALQDAERASTFAVSPRDVLYGALSGHGQAVLASRLGRGSIPGLLGRLAQGGEQAADVARAGVGAAERMNLPVTGGAMKARQAIAEQDDPSVLDQARTSLENAGARFYDWFHGATPRESVSDRNARLNNNIKQHFEETR